MDDLTSKKDNANEADKDVQDLNKDADNLEENEDDDKSSDDDDDDDTPTGLEEADNFDKCHSLLLSKRSARLIPYISRLAQERLNEKVEDGLLEDESVESVYKILSSENHNILTDGCGSWKKVRNDLEQYINAYKAFVNGKNELEKLGDAFINSKLLIHLHYDTQ